MKTYVALAPGFEIAEATLPIDILKRAGVEVITVSITDLYHVFDGEGKSATVLVTYNGMTLISGTDYVVTYEGGALPTAVGRYTVTVTGIGNYDGVIETAVLIIEKASSTVYFGSPSVTRIYTPGDTFSNLVTVLDNLDGTITYVSSNPAVVSVDANGLVTVNGAGSATVTAVVSATDNYLAQSASYTVTVQPKAVTDASLQFGSVEDQIYTGSVLTPSVLVMDGGHLLVAGRDYTVSATQSAIGTASLTLTGIGNYTGTKTVSYRIVANTAAIRIANLSNAVYDGSAKRPAPFVTYDGATLKSGINYVVSYENNVNAGIATVTVKGIGTYAGCSAIANFAIVSKSMTQGVTATVSDVIYNGSALEPVVTVTDAGKVLVRGTDYTLVYSDNVNAGLAGVTVIGMGNYDGSLALTFTIHPKELDAANVATVSDVAYTGEPVMPDITVTDGEKTLTRGVDFTVTYTDNAVVGTATAHVTFIGNYAGCADVTFAVTTVNNSLSAEITDTTAVYDGKAHSVSVLVTFNGVTLAEGTDYTVTYATADGNAPVNAGRYLVTVTGIGNYSGVITTGTLQIDKAVPSIAFETPTAATVFGNDGTKYAVNTNSTGDLSWSVSNENVVSVLDDGTVVPVHAGTATVTVTVAESENYLAGSASMTLTVAPKNISHVAVSVDYEAVFTGSIVFPTVSAKDGEKTLTAGADYTVQPVSDNVSVGEAVLKVCGVGDYEGEATFVYNIVASDYSFVVEPIPAEADDGSTHTPVPVVSYAGTVLTFGKDFTCTYENNTVAGTAVVKIRGNGAYKGCSAVATFRINATQISTGVGQGVIGSIASPNGLPNNTQLVIVRVDKVEKDQVKAVKNEMKTGSFFKDILHLQRQAAAYDVYLLIDGVTVTDLEDDFVISILTDMGAFGGKSVSSARVEEDGAVVLTQTSFEDGMIVIETNRTGRFLVMRNAWTDPEIQLYVGLGLLTVAVLCIVIFGKKKKKPEARQDAVNAQ